ncbi:FkbM family methyltransferase [Chitinibacter sp. SCUT-21]|uniref:FkbM family methyltransferase n=1 Tax=Chitinibacter sp. SCUT-21 TaxID=2970891 RepID=UPI0035A6AB71
MKQLIFNMTLKIYLYIFGRVSFQKFNHAAIRFHLRSIGILNYSNHLQSGEHFFIKQELKKIVRKKANLVFIDGGANIGSYSESLLKKFFPKAQIYAFEPNPTAFRQLINIKDNFQAINKALGAECKQSILFEPTNNPGSSHSSLYRLEHGAVNQIQIECTTLDAFCMQQGIEHIDFLKLDLEGNELDALHGANSLIKAGKITCIQFEFNEINYISKITMQDIITALPNYKLYRMLPKGLTPLPSAAYLQNIYAYQNLVAISELTQDE